ncbi:MAG: GNAT family N-acetyltransferase [Melioribacteraceae bacterium]|nr:GNAT family N-acetyltransferase [Melioribacteraceae bacterium]
MNVEIRRPSVEDIKQVNEFFRMVILDTFTKEGIGEKTDDIHDEMTVKEKYLESDLDSNGEKRYFLIAFDGDKIIGSIAYGPASDLICECTNNTFKDLMEIGTVFVHPAYQRMGIGNLLLNEMYVTLQSKGIEEFCLDSGYIRAQKIWKKKFGEPDFLLKDYWDEGSDHMIWRIKLNEVS